MDGQLTYVNKAYASIIGYDVEEALKLSYWQVTPQDYEAQEQEQLESLSEFRRYGPYEKEYIHKDGHRVPVRLSGVLIQENGVDYIWSSVEDISLGKMANDLTTKTTLLETTFENMADGISMVDHDLNLVAYNKRFLELLNFPEDKFGYGSSFESFIRYNAEREEYGPGDIEEQIRERVQLAKQFKPHFFERTTKDGKILEIHGQPMPNGGFVTRYTDVTEKRRAEIALQESEKKFREYAMVASDWFWEMDADLRFTYFSDRNREITGFDPLLYIGKTRREIYHGDLNDKHWLDHFADLEAHRSFRSFEYDLEVANGRILTISVSGDPIFDSEGNFKGYYGTGRDITDRRLAEKTLRESEQRFRALYQQSPVGICLEDYSRVKQHIDQLFDRGITDLKDFFLEHPEEMKKVVADIVLLDANDTLIKMFKCSSLEEYFHYEENFEAWKDSGWRAFYINEFTALAKGGGSYTAEFEDHTASGERIFIRCTSRVVRGGEDDWSEIITIHEDITLSKQTEKKLLEQATVDQVTGLPNRVLLFDRLSRSIEHAKREKRNICLVFVDLDRFKSVNDSRGHAAGDQLLKQVGLRLSSLVRHEDTVARLGGDEFIILLNDVELPDGPEIVATKIIDSIAHAFVIDDRETFVTASLGIAIYPEDGEEAETLLQNSDAAMYQSKHQGRNTYRFFTPGLNDIAEEHGRIAERLRHALGRGDFKLYFQPVVDVTKDRVTAVEALIRWDDAILKSVGPEILIKVAEEAGFILPIDKWVLDQSCRQVAEWRASVAPNLILSVNVSISHFRGPGLLQAVQSALVSSKLPPHALAIEITENVLIDDSPEIMVRLNTLSDMGVRLAIDDFGTGYSSLGYLKKFQVHALKIDRSFVRDITENPGDMALVEAIIAMSKSLGVLVVAEGVETAEQLKLLKEKGCYLIQGFHFSQPLSVNKMTKYLTGKLPK